jgi:hypothetical protein
LNIKKEFSEENLKDNKILTEYIENGIQRYPKDNKSIIDATFSTNFVYYYGKY